MSELPKTIRLTFTGMEPITYAQAMAAARAAHDALGSELRAMSIEARGTGGWKSSDLEEQAAEEQE